MFCAKIFQYFGFGFQNGFLVFQFRAKRKCYFFIIIINFFIYFIINLTKEVRTDLFIITNRATVLGTFGFCGFHFRDRFYVLRQTFSVFWFRFPKRF